MHNWAERLSNHINDENALKQKCAAVENIGQCIGSMNQPTSISKKDKKNKV